MKTKAMYCLRGLPGNGKSQLANRVACSVDTYETSIICSADDFFTDEKTGIYKWYPEGLGQAHTQCQSNAEVAMIKETNVVIIDNVASKRRNVELYKQMAGRYGYHFIEIMVGNLDVETSFKRNTHGVPLKTIQAMADNWEY